MQHLDEGTIHSWLDGALSADEAARVEAHVAECPQCAAVVAEARGFIAASSRILTALDNAPRGVIPVAAPGRRVNPLVWRVAATVLVVAAGTLVVVQNRGSNEPLKAVSANQAITTQQAAQVSEGGSAAQEAATRAAEGAPSNVAADEVQTSSAPTRKSPTVAFSEKAGTANTTAVAPTLAAPNLAPSRAAGIGAMDAAIEPERLKVVSSPRQIGAKVTLYEVAPGDTVTLTESMPSFLSSVVVTRARTQMAPQATAKSAGPPSSERADAAVAAAPEAQRAAEGVSSAPAVSAPATIARIGTAMSLRTISWTDPATGNTLTLTGRMPEARLQEIRIRIDRERAAAAKKNP